MELYEKQGSVIFLAQGARGPDCDKGLFWLYPGKLLVIILQQGEFGI